MAKVVEMSGVARPTAKVRHLVEGHIERQAEQETRELRTEILGGNDRDNQPIIIDSLASVDESAYQSVIDAYLPKGV